MRFYDNSLYMEDVQKVIKMQIPWEKLSNKSFMITGATGLIGSFLIDVLMEKNKNENLNCTILAMVRNEKKAKERFSEFKNNKNLIFLNYDVNNTLVMDEIDTVDYILHLASNTHPILYSTDPIGTITTNVIGVKNLLEFAANHNVTRFAFASSNEIYGENRGDSELFDETYCGYINCNTLRAGYPESKRCGEALCQAYIVQKGMDIVIPRITRTFGPTMSFSDTKAASQFLKNGIAGKDIVLKSKGKQYYSYTYVSDAVSGLLYVLLCGEKGEAYNISDEKCDIRLGDLAELIAKICGTKVVYELPSSLELSGYSTATKARLNGNKLKKLGWNISYDINSGIERTINILKFM